MKRILLVLVLASTSARSEESKPVATQVGDALRPATKAYGKAIKTLVDKLFSGSKGPIGEAARTNHKNESTSTRAKPIVDFGAP